MLIVLPEFLEAQVLMEKQEKTVPQVIQASMDEVIVQVLTVLPETMEAQVFKDQLVNAYFSFQKC